MNWSCPGFLRGSLDVAAQLVQELVHPRQAFLGRVDRAIDERLLVVCARRKRAERDDQVLQFDDGAARFDPLHAAGGRLAPGFGRPGDHDVAGFRIAEHVLQPGQPGQVLHGVVDAAPVGQTLLDDPVESRERNFSQRAANGHIAVEFENRFLSALPRELAGGVVHRDASQDAIGVDGHAGGCTAADRVAATTAAAAKLGPRSLLHDQ